MNSNWEKDYPLASNLSEADLDENSSLKKMLRLIGENKRVIDFGCATGYFAQLLTNKGCLVTGVEINAKAAKVAEQYCEQVIVADLDVVCLSDILPVETFDVAVFGDVLEHLRDPWSVLEKIKQLLKPEGYVVASIPNIAHGAIRLALLQGRFEYMELGILDNTHLRFFTRKTVADLFDKSGYFIDVIERTKLPIFSESNLVPSIDKNQFEIKVIEGIEQDEDSDTLQFVMRAFPLSVEGKYASLHQSYCQLVNEVEKSHTQMQQINAELEKAESQIQDKEMQLERSQSQLKQTQVEFERSQSQLQQTQVEFERSQSQLQQIQSQVEQLQSQLKQTQAELERSQSQLKQTQAELERSQSQLKQTQAELERSQLQQTQVELERSQSQQYHEQVELQQVKARITAIESSKFWKLRKAWFRLKGVLRLKADE